MIPYFIKSAICLLLLLAFYQLFLEREKMHQFNRYYLLGSILFSFLVPFYTIYTKAAAPVFETLQTPNVPIENIEIQPETFIETSFNYSTYLLSIYIIISSILLLRFGKNLYKIIQKIRKNQKVRYKNATLILVNDSILPHTFFRYIFINKTAYENGNIETELFTHELTHVTQKHTIDVLLIEVLQIVFWINPIFISLKKAIKLNHEFLADTNVISSHKNISEYQSLLLNKAAWNNEFYLASNLNYSLTKKRLLMMTTHSSQRKILFKKLAILPILASFVFLFANRIEAQETITVNQKSLNKFKVETEEQLYKDFFFKDIQIITTDKNGKKVKKTLTKTELNNWNKENKKTFEKLKKSKKKLTLKKSSKERIKTVSKHQKGVLKKQLATYNRLAKKHNTITEKNSVIKLKDLQKLKSIYKLMSKEQKKDSEPFPKQIPPPSAPEKMDFTNIPPPPPRKNKKNKTIKAKQIKIDSILKPTIFTFKTLSGKKTVHKLDSLKTKIPDNVKYYLNNKLISKTELNTIKVNSIDKVKVINIKKGEQAIYIISHKQQ